MNINYNTLENASRKTKYLKESVTVNQDLIENKVAKLVEKTKKQKKFVEKKDSKIKEN